VQRPLLLADALINLLLGVLLLLYPQWLVEALGMPVVANTFFPNVLGGVLFGIGVALLIAHRGGVQGLGLDGAIAINLCGAGVVVGWLVATNRLPVSYDECWRFALVTGFGASALFALAGVNTYPIQRDVTAVVLWLVAALVGVLVACVELAVQLLRGEIA